MSDFDTVVSENEHLKLTIYIQVVIILYELQQIKLKRSYMELEANYEQRD